MNAGHRNRAAICRQAAALLMGGILTAQAEVTLIKNGQARARIYAAAGQAQAAGELNYHLQCMAGAALEVVSNAPAGASKGPAIILGQAAVDLGSAPQKTSLSQEGYRILVKGDRVLIGGESDAAVLFGVYALLEKLGCAWVMPGAIGEIIPAAKTVAVPAFDESSAPDFLTRRLWYRGYNPPRLAEEAERFEQWLRRQKAGSWTHPAAGCAGHIWDRFIELHQAEFDKDPTMLALVRLPDGTLKRKGPQLESTHPRVLELFVQDIKATYRKNIAEGKWTRDTTAGFGIGPADGLGYSLSPEAQNAGAGRMDPIVGEIDRTDELVLLGNKILADVHKEYPNAHVGFYSYSTHADYPARYKPDPKLVVIFAPINFSRFHGILDANSKTQPYYREVVQQWAALSRAQGNVLIYRGYNWNLADNMLPYTKIRIWGEELPFYKTNQVIGLNVEATKAWSINGASDYVFMKLAWDASLDWKQVLRTYCEKSFGGGAQPMERYFLRLIAAQHGAGQEAGSYHAFPLIYDDAWVEAAAKDIAAALKAAAAEGDKTRIRFIAEGIEALRLYRAYQQATLRFDFPAVKAAYDALLAQWDRTYKINTDLVANETPAYLKRFLLAFVEGGLKYSTTPYQMAFKIPDELPTLFDPYGVGYQLNYQNPAVSDAGFLRSKTYTSTWDAQGLAALRSVAVWYRVRFALPADARGKPVGLFIGSVEDEARVWINGRPVGTSGRGFSKPALFDLTEGVRYEGDNLLAIQVIRNSKANEIGLGGILRPSFIFTGPRLEQKAQGELQMRRVLPGGELGATE
jgi:hypothetical protein